MPTIRTRAAKGSALTHNEVDDNFKRTARQVTATGNILVSDNRGTVEGNHASVGITLTLPTVAAAGAAEPGDFIVRVTNINSAIVSVDGSTTETINGSTDAITQGQWESATFELDSAGAGWVTTSRVGDLGTVNSAGLKLTSGNVTHNDANSSVGFSGGSTVSNGGMFIGYGESHATRPGDFILRSNTNTVVDWDESTGTFLVNTGTGGKTTALTLDSSQNATFAGTVDVSGTDVTITNAINPTLIVTDSSSGITSRLISTDTTGAVGTSSNHQFIIQTNGTNALTFNTSQNATFAGAVDVNGTDITLTNATDPSLIVVDSTNSVDTRLRSLDTSGQVGTASAHVFTVFSNNAAAVTFDTSQNATFTGTVDVSGTDVTLTNATNPAFIVTDTGAATTTLQSANTTGVVGTTSAHNLEIRTGGTAAITIDTSQNATFAGTVTDSNGLLPFPSGTLMLFQQTAAPTGWTKQTTHNNKALRVVSGTASSGGTSPFSTVFGLTATDSHTLVEAEMPAHTHGTDVQTTTEPQYDAGNARGGTQVSGRATSTSTGGGGGHSHNIELRVQYVDLIIASKD
jgi:sorbitol-specific phosphotransferase system component IIA